MLSREDLCEGFNRCRPAALPRDAGPVQRLSVNTVQVVLHHKLEHMRSPENMAIFNGRRHNKVRALQPYATSIGSSAFFHEHHEFIGQGYWRGPYPYTPVF